VADDSPTSNSAIRLCSMTRAGLEPATYGLKVRCSTS
jgi:hypothetical protein